MMNIRRIILEDIAIAALAVVLWSPIVGLTPFDPNILRAALAVTSYIAIPAAAVIVNRPLLSIGDEKLLPASIDPDVRGDALGNGDELRRALEIQSSLPHVGSYASEALRQIDSARRKHRQVVDMLSTGKLTPGSLAWQRFVSGIDEAEMTIRNNAALVSSACTSFDGNDYAQLSEVVSTGRYREDNVDDDVQIERLHIYQSTIRQLKNIIGNNERILLELDRFASEVSMQAMTPSDESSERMLTEMRVLIDEARRYE
ncbi:MAG: hypothetical protein IKE22_01655 [Atopobiaceae bacterium]|nr:hypothetical protein [Atopobiaceae bacterium]